MQSRLSIPVLLLTSLFVLGSCGDDEPEETAGAVGSSCSGADSCDEGLECTASGKSRLCTYPTGETCDASNDDLENGGCQLTDVCSGGGADAGDEEARCRVRKGEECNVNKPWCDAELVCAELINGERRCFEPFFFRGEVTDSSNAEPIEDAHVIAIDDEGVAVSDVALSDEAGHYELPVPVVRKSDGTPATASFTLKASAQDYQPFPSGIRVALPISTTEANLADDSYAVDSALTDISLIPLEDAERYAISGQVHALEHDDAGVQSEVGGVLVIASGPEGTYSAITDQSGSYTIFNVPPGDYEVKGYASGIQIETETTEVADAAVTDVDLNELAAGTTTVSGTVQIVNAAGGSATSVILVVEDTFDPNTARGEVPRGLRAPKTGTPDVTGAFEITGVPAGRYVVLAAYENDSLVLDPDTNISGTDFVSLEITADEPETTLSESFKVTEALAVMSPGTTLPEEVTEKPNLVWADDSSEDWYEVRVYDAFGNEVWQDENVPSVSGSDTASLQYEGPLDPGMYYQFRVTSWRQPGGKDAAPISRTEDLRGVFFAPAE